MFNYYLSPCSGWGEADKEKDGARYIFTIKCLFYLLEKAMIYVWELKGFISHRENCFWAPDF